MQSSKAGGGIAQPTLLFSTGLRGGMDGVSAGAGVLCTCLLGIQMGNSLCPQTKNPSEQACRCFSSAWQLLRPARASLS